MINEYFEEILYQKRFIFSDSVVCQDSFYNIFTLKSISVDFDTKYIDMSVRLIIGCVEYAAFYPTPNNRILNFDTHEIIINPLQNFYVEIKHDEFNYNLRIYVLLNGVLSKPFQ